MFISLSSYVLWYSLSSGGTYIQEFLGFYSKIYASCISSFYSGRLDDRIFFFSVFLLNRGNILSDCSQAVCGHGVNLNLLNSCYRSDRSRY